MTAPDPNANESVSSCDAGAVHTRQFLAPVIVGREEVRLMPGGGNQVEQHDADAQRLVPRHAPPEFLETAEQKAGVAGFLKGDFIPIAAEIGHPGRCRPKRRQ